jgi:hypothetical protein
MNVTSEQLNEKEKQVEISRLEHNILEFELKYLKKLEELQRLEDDINKFKQSLTTKKEGKK